MAIFHFKNLALVHSATDYPVACRRFSIAFLLLFTLTSRPVLAQDQDAVKYVVFDPVPIDPSLAVPPAEGSKDPPTLKLDAIPVLKQGSPVPSDKTPVQLSDWFAAQSPDSSVDPEQVQNTISSYEKTIADVEEEQGPYAEDLSQQLGSLADAYRQIGNVEKSLELDNRAAYVTRINKGLFTADQIPFIQNIVEDKVRLGDLIAADEEEEYLFYLQQKLHGDDPAAMLPALKNYAEWNVFAFNSRLLDLPKHGKSDSNSGKSGGSNVTPMEEQDFRLRRLIYAQNIYWSIVQILKTKFGINDPRLQDAEIDLAQTNYFYATSVSIPDDTFSATAMINTNPTQKIIDAPGLSINDMGYKHGREALERRVSYLSHAEKPDEEALVKATVDLSDWMIFFRKQRDTYQKAQDKLPQAELDGIFSPAYPILIPSFITPYNSRMALDIPDDQPMVYNGYIDAMLTLDAFGQTRETEILDMSDGTPNAIVNRLYRNLGNSQFRPRVKDGALLKTDTIYARYYYSL